MNKHGLATLTQEQRKAVFAKRRLTMIAKHGSEEAYLKAMKSYGSIGGNTVTELTKYRGGGAKHKKSD